MPLADLIRNLNSSVRALASGFYSTAPFVSADGQVFVHYAGLRLESRFVPYVESTGGKTLGHGATLVTTGLGNRRQLEPEAVFALPTDAEEFVYLDRLVRTLHALNYLIHPAPGNLLLKVHPRHVASVRVDHGLAFEEILRPCGLVPAQITLEIQAGGAEHHGHLERAVANYKSRGYGIALSRFGHGSVDFGLLQEIRPHIVKLAPALLASGRPLHRLIEGLHALGSLVMADSADLSALRPRGPLAGIDLLLATTDSQPKSDRHAVLSSATGMRPDSTSGLGLCYT